ncbi:UV DNA damage repair endonuclease UvsE [Domibacillus indicus]|uniref:UV DNA damage repair endonuclease UvsE n=1 Tax=Domibacillus indicus TaxID=1437523 RepID=UPI00203DB15D|nr:UV DNA damage repair endonuclease UvsE [Domibacillus indicus]MCM3789396.1 UV DNA damage repair endonuclease UvsE [Domibacillus indicus]
MRIGYACINMSMPSKFKTCRLKTAETEGMAKIKELALHNLNETLEIIKWNVANRIYFYRMSSNLIPLATHPVVTWEWGKDEDVLKITDEIKELAAEYDVRLSVHPGQYTLINSPNEEVVQKSILDLIHHQELLDLTGGRDMILHVGGAYGDKESAKERFAETFKQLPEAIKQTMRIENDDKIFTIHDVLDVCGETGAAACFDIHHHACNHEEDAKIDEVIQRAVDTWQHKEIPPKMHISSGRDGKTDRAHHNYILEDDWRYFIEHLPDSSIDVMVEAKMKELAVLQIREQYR